MKSERDKMLSGELYNPFDRELVEDRRYARLLLQKLNNSIDENERETVLKSLLPGSGEKLDIQIPFYCDYGKNIITGDNVFFNFNCIVLDVMQVKIGNRTLIGPNVQIYTALHSMNYKERAAGLEYARSVVIGEDVWIGGGAIICPGVTIGDGSVIGAGSVVTNDIPRGVFAAGNPCKVIRSLHVPE